MSMREELIADLLMGAACADGELSGDEVGVVRGLLARVLGAAALSQELEARLAAFDPAAFDAERALGWLGLVTPMEKRYLLELIAAVRDADGVLDLAEDAYLRRVAQALGLARDAYADLVLDVDELPQVGAALLGRTPPPLPRS